MPYELLRSAPAAAALVVTLVLTAKPITLTAQETSMVDQTAQTAQIVADFGTAMGSGDFNALQGLFAEDAEWRVEGSPDVPWVGSHVGPEAIASFLQTFGREVELLGAETLATGFDGPHAFLINRMSLRMHQSGEIVDLNTAVHIEVSNGKIIRYHVYEDSYAVATAYAN